MRYAVTVLALMLIVLVAPFAGPATAAELRDLGSVDDLRTLVDRDKTLPRLVLLLSPT